MKAKYASCSILLLALNKISCYFQSRLHINFKLCSVSNKSLPVAEETMPGHQDGTVKRRQHASNKQSQEAVNSHANDSLAYKIDLNMTVQTQLLSIHSKIYSSKQQGFQSGSRYYRITNFV